jgi:transglutaminase-like putative cysteine protease
MFGLFSKSKLESSLVPHRLMKLIVFAYIALLVPHFERIPLTAIIYIALIVSWRLLNIYINLPLPGVFAKVLLVVAMVSLLIVNFAVSLSVNSAVAFFAIVLGLKLLEIKKADGLYSYIFLLMYLAATQFLFEQHLFVVLYQVFCIGVLFYILLTMHSPHGVVASDGIFSIGKMLMVATPFVVIIFLFFPRMAPLWSVPLDSGSARTGISDEMSPGDIANLAQSDERAFRVKFKGDTPPARELYWKGLVLDIFDGQRWSSSENSFVTKIGRVPDIRLQKDVSNLSYQVTIEATNQLWGFSLADPLPASNNIYVSTDGLVRFREMLLNTSVYQVDHAPSAASMGTSGLTYAEQQRFLQIPRTNNARTKAWVGDQLNKLGSIEAVFASLLEKIATEDYRYSLQPPRLGDNFVDEFLFDSKVGFCAHYASATAYIARLLGIPSRVVIGYQGGEYIAQGDYVVVHQYDAHAWVEVWQYGRGWLRVDPTAYVAPDRIERGIREATREEGGFLSDNIFSAARYDDFGIVRWARQRMDMANYYWQQKVVGYSGDNQSSLMMEWFNSNSIELMASLMAGCSLIVFVLLLLIKHRQWLLSFFHRSSYYETFCQLFAAAGFPRAPGEGPKKYAQRLRQSVPDAAPQIDFITNVFIAQTFKASGDKSAPINIDKMIQAQLLQLKKKLK